MQIDNISNSYSFRLGKKQDGSECYCDFKEVRHLIIAGGDKDIRQNFIVNIVKDLNKNSAENNIECMIFSKDKSFNKFQIKDNNFNNKIYSIDSDFIKTIDFILKETEERLEFLKINDYKDFNDYLNSKEKHKKKFKNIFVIFDEIKEIISCYKDEFLTFIRKHLLMAGIVGIHFIFATNYCSTDVLVGTLKAAIFSRIAFKTSSKFESEILIDSPNAFNLTKEEIYFFFNFNLTKLKV